MRHGAVEHMMIDAPHIWLKYLFQPIFNAGLKPQRFFYKWDRQLSLLL